MIGRLERNYNFYWISSDLIRKKRKFRHSIRHEINSKLNSNNFISKKFTSYDEMSVFESLPEH